MPGLYIHWLKWGIHAYRSPFLKIQAFCLNLEEVHLVKVCKFPTPCPPLRGPEVDTLNAGRIFLVFFVDDAHFCL